MSAPFTGPVCNIALALDPCLVMTRAGMTKYSMRTSLASSAARTSDALRAASGTLSKRHVSSVRLT